MEFAIGGLSNLLTGGKSVVELVLGKDLDSRIQLILDLLDRNLGCGRNDAIVVGAVVCLSRITRHGSLPQSLKPALTGRISELERNSDSSTFALKNHAVILKDLLR